MKHADPRTLEARFTIGRVLALAWRAWLACRWPILLIGVPSAIVSVGARWLTFPYLEETVPVAWHEMVLMWQSGLIQCIAYVSVTFAAVSHMRGQRPCARDLVRFPWRRLPVVFGVGVILTGVTWWPEPLLDWSVDDDYGIVVDYAILTVNVLVIDVLTFALLPILVVEDRSIVSSVRRSAHFAARHPWRILAIDMGFWGIYFLFSKAVLQVYSWADPEWADLAWNAMIAVWIAFSVSAGCCLAAAIYHVIRHQQEGPAPEMLARVFD